MRLEILIALSWRLALAAPPTFYRDVLPILQSHCQSCHRQGEIGPMALSSYRETRPWARAIREAVVSRKMPPWFADPRYGWFANDPSLNPAEIETIAQWAAAGAPRGLPADALPQPSWTGGWSLGVPDAVFAMSQAIAIPANREMQYQYLIVPTGFREDRWVQRVEFRPGDRSVVHHAVVYIREPGSPWLRNMPIGRAFSLPPREGATRSDILFTYAPGNPGDSWPPGLAKKIPAGSDLVFQMHYTSLSRATSDLSRVGMIFAKAAPSQRVLSLQLNQDRFVIPPGVADFEVHVSGTLPGDCRLLSLFPHMHLRGKAFQYAIVRPDGRREILLSVQHYDFNWQLTYRLAEPRLLPAGTRLEAVATFDNSRNNPRNPDPEVAVYYGESTSDEMVVGFFDIAVDASLDKFQFFEQRALSPSVR